MSGKWMFRLWMTVAALCVTSAAAGRALERPDLPETRRYRPGETVHVAEENGPWMVMACSFSGEGAEKQAHELVLELRKRYKLPAYVYLGHFDPGKAEVPGFDKYGKNPKGSLLQIPRQRRTANTPTWWKLPYWWEIIRAADDPKAQSMLHTLKYAKPKCLEVKEGQGTHQTLTGWRLAQQQVYEMIGSSKKELGPMRHAMIVPNPLLPPDYFNQQRPR